MTTPEHADRETLAAALEKAAKHICTSRCGLCPNVVEQYPCPQECSLETMAWHCWQQYFLDQAEEGREK